MPLYFRRLSYSFRVWMSRVSDYTLYTLRHIHSMMSMAGVGESLSPFRLSWLDLHIWSCGNIKSSSAVISNHGYVETHKQGFLCTKIVLYERGNIFYSNFIPMNSYSIMCGGGCLMDVISESCRFCICRSCSRVCDRCVECKKSMIVENVIDCDRFVLGELDGN